MTTFDKREEVLERQFAHDEELKFKAAPQPVAQPVGRKEARAHWHPHRLLRALGRHVAEFEDADEHDVGRKIRKDFDAERPVTSSGAMKVITCSNQYLRSEHSSHG